MPAGMEKIIRVYDLEKPTEAPEQLASQPSGIRCLSFLQHDNLLMCSYTDKNGIV